jgi:glycosyltransferase involved in cell wall biosynthesis
MVLTRYQLEQLSRFGFTRQNGIHLVPFGAEAPFFRPGEQKPPAPPFHILHVGDLNRVKDQRTLLKAFRLIREQTDCRLRIVGEDTLGGEVQRYAGELGISDAVTFAGFVPHDSLGPHFAWAHLLLHASLYEGQGVVFAEAAAAGLPICGTRVGLLADLGEHFAAIAEPRDHEGLSRAALRVLGDASLRDSLAAGARTWAGEHNADRTAGLVAGVYGSVQNRE